MPPQIRRTTHVPVTLSINSKRRGKVQNENIDLLSNSANSTVSNCETPSSQFDLNVPEIQQPPCDTSSNSEQKTNHYYDNRKKEISAWQDLRAHITQSMLEREAPITDTCVICKSMCSPAIRCLECSSTYTACVSCALEDHAQRPLHSIEIWKVRLCVVFLVKMFIPI